MIEPTISPRLPRIALAVIVVFVMTYIYVYLETPFPSPWSDIVLLLAIVIPVFLAAVVATHIWLTFRQDDTPRPVWRSFSLGLWSWMLAELGWLVYWLILGNIPNPSYLDFFWLLGYLFFGLSFMYQFRLVAPGSIWNELRWLVGVTLGVVALALLTTMLIMNYGWGKDLRWISTFFDVFYVFADLGVTVAALRLAGIFGRGLWGSTWIALWVMTLSDALYSFMALSGYYALSVESGNLLSMLTDLLYALSYLIMAIVCYEQYLLIRHGPSLTPHQSIDEIAPPDGLN